MRAVFDYADNTRDYKEVNRKQIKKFVLIIAAFSAFFIVLGICLVASGHPDRTDSGITSIVSGGLLALLVPFVYVALRFAEKRHIKTNKIYFGATVHAEFDDERFLVESRNEISKSTVQSGYEGLFKVSEYDKVFAFYTSNMTVFIVSKSGLVEGDISELRAFLRERLHKRYKIKFRVGR
ncbi:MAG: YcxB family protein [Clostridiales bacterium]|jgi:hypothetical protein|nr:YcxB family protein [Clostridiales bacterium]